MRGKDKPRGFRIRALAALLAALGLFLQAGCAVRLFPEPIKDGGGQPGWQSLAREADSEAEERLLAVEEPGKGLQAVLAVKETPPVKVPEEKTPEPGPEGEDWMLRLVNADNPLSSTYAPVLKALRGGLLFDERAVEHLESMLDAARAEGLRPIVCSAYRTFARQETLHQKQVWKQRGFGLQAEEAERAARRVVAYPGTSEHQLGLAADIVSNTYRTLDSRQAETAEFLWLREHCWEYGFILRYPEDKTDITGIIYEPWHFRYVGVAAAETMMAEGLCLEEYLSAPEAE